MNVEEQLQFRDLIKLEDELKALKETVEVVKASCLDSLMRSDDDKFIIDGFEFSVSAKRTYGYSSTVDDLTSQLKNIKKEELADGTAVLVTDGHKLVKRKLKGSLEHDIENDVI